MPIGGRQVRQPKLLAVEVVVPLRVELRPSLDQEIAGLIGTMPLLRVAGPTQETRAAAMVGSWQAQLIVGVERTGHQLAQQPAAVLTRYATHQLADQE